MTFLVIDATTHWVIFFKNIKVKAVNFSAPTKTKAGKNLSLLS